MDHEHLTPLPEGLLELLKQPSLCYVATSMPDGSPQLTQTWVDTDGRHILINTVAGFQKVRNVERDPRVALTVSDPDRPSRYYAVRGRVIRAAAQGGADHIEALAQRYLGGPYPWFGGREQVRLILTIAPAVHRLVRRSLAYRGIRATRAAIPGSG
jgi:PPOX class probable F420-dependent enzyme